MPSRRLSILLATLALALLTRAAAAPPPSQSVVLPGIDEAAMRARLLATDMQPLEGIYSYPTEQMTIGIERWHGDDGITHRLVLLASDDLDLLPGTVMGFMAPSAKDNKYRLWLYSERDRVTLFKPMECVATVDADGSITFDPPHWRVKVRVNFARFLPSIFRGVSIIPEIEKEKLPVGFKKIFPENERKPNRVRYL